MIYLDNAATSIHKPQAVIDAIVHALTSMGNAGRGTHEAALESARLIFSTRQQIAQLFNAESASQVAFTANSTESLNTVIGGIFQANDHVITTELEHNSVLRPLYRLQVQGIIELSIIPADKQGNIQLADFEQAIKPNTKGIVCTHASNVTGNIVDVGAIGNICRKHQLIFIVDASQTAGVIPLDMQAMQIDVVCFTGHKSLLGPQGIGGICVNKNIYIRPLKVGGSGVQTYSKIHPEQMPTALEAGTLNGVGIAGLNASINYINEIGIDNLYAKESALMWEFYNKLKDLAYIKIYGDFSKPIRCPIVALNIRDLDSALVSDALLVQYNIATRSGGHCAPLMHQALGTVEQGLVRFSFSYLNTSEEIDIVVNALKELAEL